MELKNILLITSDVNKTSAQGVRYCCLFSEYLGYQIHTLSFNMPLSFIIDPIENICLRNINSKWLNTLRTFNLKVLRHLLNTFVFPDWLLCFLPLYRKRLRKLMKLCKYSYIIIGVTPFSLLMLSKWLRMNINDCSIIADMSDPFSFNMGNRGRFRRIRIARYIETRAFPYFDKIIVLNETIQRRYQQLYPKLAEKFQVVEQGVDEVFINKIKAFSGSNTIADEFTFLYAGGFYKNGRNPSNLYKAFELSELDCKLEIYGNIRKINRPQTSNKIKYHKALDKMQLADITAKANALILFDNDYGYQVPGKTIETLASGKPVLFIYNNDKSPTLQYVKKAKGVVWVKNSVPEIEEGIYKIIKGEYAQPYFDYSPYTWEQMRIKLKDIIDNKGK